MSIKKKLIFGELMDYNQITDKWEDSSKYSPAPRHRRRIIVSMIKNLQYESVLDAGCAQPYLLEFFVQTGKKGYGCDISDKVIEKNRARLPNCKFESFDLSAKTYPAGQKFDLIICSEVLEHIENWRSALNNLMQMTNKYILITVPSGNIRYIDKKVGHIHHFRTEELIDEFSKHGFSIVTIKKWGFPIHTLYKILVNLILPENLFREFSISTYSNKKIALSQCLFFLFFINDLFRHGEQLFILAKQGQSGGLND